MKCEKCRKIYECEDCGQELKGKLRIFDEVKRLNSLLSVKYPSWKKNYWNEDIFVEYLRRAYKMKNSLGHAGIVFKGTPHRVSVKFEHNTSFYPESFFECNKDKLKRT